MIEITGFRSADNGGAVLAECRLSGEDVTVVRGRPVRYAVYALIPERYASLGLTKGPVSEELRAELIKEDEKYKALRQAERILAFSSNSLMNVRTKLTARGYSREAADFAAGELLKKGEINESEDALRAAEKLVASGKGRKNVIAALRAKGYRADSLEKVSAYLDGVDFPEVCRLVILKKWKEIPEDMQVRKKMVASLYRLGFSGNEITEAARRIRTK